MRSGAAGLLTLQVVAVPAGPGVVQVAVQAVLPTSEHSTRVTAVSRDTGAARTIVAERLMRWGSHAGHRSPGAAQASALWEFPEGGNQGVDTFVALWNPTTVAAPVRLYYRHENGNLYVQNVTLAPLSRAVLATPGGSWGVPSGRFAVQAVSLDGHGIFAERMVYGGAGWAFGHASAGAPSGAQTWRFAEGTGVAPFDTFVLIANLANAANTVTVTYRTSAGAVIGGDTLVVAPYSRGTVWANGTAGAQDFTITVTSSHPVVAERAMFWPTGGSSLLGEASSGAIETSLEEAPTFTVPYTLTPGTVEPPILGAGPGEEVVGRRPPGPSTLGDPTTQSLSGGSWYGSHLAVGRKP